MRCSCRVCGTYMIQREHGLQSGCKCPDCGFECKDCMGSAQQPMDAAALAARFARIREDEDLREDPADWRKEL